MSNTPPSSPPGSPPYADMLRDLPPGRIYSKPAMRICSVEMLEEVPTHDGTPCLTLWERYIHFKTDPRHCDGKGRPKMGIQIYDITPGSNNKEHLMELVRHIDSVTKDERTSRHDDRLDIYGFPIPEDMPEEARVQRCIDHNIAESRARNATGRSDYYIPPTFEDYGYQHGIVIVDRPRESWDEGEGGFILAQWDYKRLEGRIYDSPPSDVESYRCLAEELAGTVRDVLKGAHGWFMDTYVWDGYLDQEVRDRAREARNLA